MLPILKEEKTSSISKFLKWRFRVWLSKTVEKLSKSWNTRVVATTKQECGTSEPIRAAPGSSRSIYWVVSVAIPAGKSVEFVCSLFFFLFFRVGKSLVSHSFVYRQSMLSQTVLLRTTLTRKLCPNDRTSLNYDTNNNR